MLAQGGIWLGTKRLGGDRNMDERAWVNTVRYDLAGIAKQNFSSLMVNVRHVMLWHNPWCDSTWLLEKIHC